MAIAYADSWLGQKVITANKTMIFTASELPGSKVCVFHVELQGATQLQNIDRIRLKAGGSDVFNGTPAQLRSYLQRMSRGNIVVPTTAQSFSIPLNIPDGRGMDRYSCQFPPGQAPQMELAFGAGATTNDTVNVSWTGSEQSPDFFQLFLSEAHGIPANSTRKPYAIVRGGKVRCLIIPTTGLTQLQIRISGVTLVTLNSVLLQEWQRMENAQTLQLADPICIKLHEPMDAAQGSSEIMLTTGAAWDPLGEIALVSLVLLHPQ